MKTDIFFFFFFLILSITSISAFPLFPNSTTDADDHSDDPWHYYFTNLTGCHAGDHAQGLAKLKQYFHHFGYIPDDQNPSYNFTDDFDDSLESALKTYQLNFNLDPTGTLDEPTLSQITRPRCGVADIINGSTTMKSGKKPSGLHSVAHYAFFPGQPRWPQFKRQLTYAFFPGNQLKDSVKSVFTRAFSRWSAVTPLTFTETQDYSNSDLKIGFFVGNHGDGEPFDGVLGTLAHAFSPPDGRFHLDGAEKWVVDGSLSGSDSVDLESVAVHEIGHLLGLGHTSVEEAIMFPTISSGKKKTELAKDDVDGIQQLYGGNPNYVGGAAPATTTPSSQERERSDTSGGGQGLVGGGVWWSTLVAMSLVGILFIF